MDVLTVQEKEIAIIKVHDEDYISLTDMLQAKDGGFFISDWLRNRNTIEFLGIWEKFIMQSLIMANLPQLQQRPD